MSFDRPPEGDSERDGVPSLEAGPRALAALAVRLDAHGLTTALTGRGLRVGNPDSSGCCPDNPHLGDLITCKPFDLDGGRLWFFTSGGEPISRAGRVTDAVSYLRDRLGSTGRRADISALARVVGEVVQR